MNDSHSADGQLVHSGENILFNHGFGEYFITFNATEKSYLIEKVTEVEEAPLSAPVANAGEDVDIFVGDTVNFNASNSSDTDGEILSYRWSNGLIGVSVSSVYDQAGSYAVMLTVTDNDGLTATDKINVNVQSGVLANPNDTTSNSGENNSRSGGSISWLLLLLLNNGFTHKFILSYRIFNNIRT